MELPPALRHAVDGLLDGVSTDALAEAFATLSGRYRAETRDGRFHVAEELTALAYLATRLPATYAAIRAALDEVAQARPDLEPKSQLDLGAGPGTAAFAARDLWPSINQIDLIEGSAAMRRAGALLLEGSEPDAASARFAWSDADLATKSLRFEPADLVTIGYVLDELDDAVRIRLVDAAWAACGDTLLVVEPGTPAGWRRILEVRTRLLAAGAHLVAPCAHSVPCPIVPPDWCHFSRRVARSRIHLRGKSAVVPFEDEKFIYVAFARTPVGSRTARILTPPRQASGRVSLKLCQPDGHVEERLISRRDGDLFKRARRLDWGDALES